MRTTVKAAATAQGASPWVPVSDYQNPVGVSLFASLESGATATFKVQHTPDDLQNMRQPTSITRSTVTATVVDPDHGLATGDNLQVFNSGDPNLDTTKGLGVDVTVVDKDTYTYTVANTGLAAALPTVRVVTARCFDHAQMTGLTARTDGNYAFPVRGVRLRITASGGANNVDLTVIQGAGR